MRSLGIDYGDARVGIAITDALGITAQGLETINRNGSDKIVLIIFMIYYIFLFCNIFFNFIFYFY